MRLDVILTSDRTMMSNYHGKEFLGFGSTGPMFVDLPFKLSEKFHLYLFAPALEVDKQGFPIQAPYGMRKIEAKLLEAGINARIVDPDHVHRYIDEARILMLSHHDYFGLNPPSSTWSVIVGKEPMNAYMFRKFMEDLQPHIARAKKRGLKVVVGGPSAWQWLMFPDLVEKWGIDVIFDGEGEGAVVGIVRRILEGEPVPKYVYVGVSEAPTVDEIPVIRGASINGLVEIGRGCPLGCAFCSVTLRPTRWYPLEKIEQELMVNVSHGVVDGILHSDDVPLYGSTGILPNPDKLVALHKLAKKYYRKVGWSHTTFASVLAAEKKLGGLTTKIAEIMLDGRQEWWGAQVGLETGSIRLAKKIMPGKAAPYSIDKWWDVVLESMALMHEVRLIPAITIIVGLPGEEPDDVMQTIELIERMRPYRSLVVPLFYVPMSHIRADKRGWMQRVNLLPEHIELLRVVFRHSIYWAKDILNRFYLKDSHNVLLRVFLNYFIGYVEKNVKKIDRYIEAQLSGLTSVRASPTPHA